MASLSTLISSSLSQGLVTKSAAPLFNPLMAFARRQRRWWVPRGCGRGAGGRCEPEQAVLSAVYAEWEVHVEQDEIYLLLLQQRGGCIGARQGENPFERIAQTNLQRREYRRIIADDKKGSVFHIFYLLFAKVRFFPKRQTKTGLLCDNHTIECMNFIHSEWNLKYSSKHNLQQEQAVFMLTLLKFIVLSETHRFAEIKNKELFMNIQMININCLFPLFNAL